MVHGQHEGETGMVVRVENPVAYVFTDSSHQVGAGAAWAAWAAPLLPGPSPFSCLGRFRRRACQPDGLGWASVAPNCRCHRACIQRIAAAGFCMRCKPLMPPCPAASAPEQEIKVFVRDLTLAVATASSADS